MKATNNDTRLADLARSVELINNQMMVLSESVSRLYREGLKVTVPPDVQKEIQSKVADAAVNAVMSTPCRTPDLGPEVNRIRETVEMAVYDRCREAIKGVPVSVEHRHTHTHLLTSDVVYYLKKYVDKSQKVLACYALAVSVALACNSCWFFSSELYWGHRLWKVCTSEYQTDPALRENAGEAFGMVHERFSTHEDRRMAKSYIRGFERSVRASRREARGAGR